MTSRPGPGTIVLFGSGEASPNGRRAWDWAFSRLQAPVTVSVLETPAGFELNSDKVAGRIAEFLRERLQNYQPEVSVIPARRKGSAFSPDDPSILAPVRKSNAVFIGPGSPTYAARQLKDSLAWELVRERHRRGATLVLASAAAIAISAHVLPVYEVFKAGEDVHWKEGLDLFGPLGLKLVFVPHWDNSEGGDELDTSRCFMGRSRFDQLLGLLPFDVTVVGIDEHTALAFDAAEQVCHVIGRGGVTLTRSGGGQRFSAGETFPMSALGDYSSAPWEHDEAEDDECAEEPDAEHGALHSVPGEEVERLVAEREDARRGRDWARADQIRARILSLGWQVSDTPEGPRVTAAP
jgi:hypothetical protein